MLLSVIVPTIGRPKYFGKTLDSIARQRVAGFDVLVSDNASNPPVSDEEISARLSRVPHQLLRRYARLGFSAHFNQCLKDARGEWVVFISDDDLISHDFIAAHLAEIRKADEGVSMIVSRQHVIDERCLTPPPVATGTEVVRRKGIDFVKECQAGKFPELKTIVSMCARREDFLQVGGFPDYPHGLHADNMVWMHLATRGDTLYLPVVLHYRVYEASVGLAAPVSELLAASLRFEADLARLIGGVEGGVEVMARWRYGNTGVMLSRWSRRVKVFSPSTWHFMLLVRIITRIFEGKFRKNINETRPQRPSQVKQ